MQNKETGNWSLIDYAARDDDSLSLWFLLLADWHLAQQNRDGWTTLEIAAEYGGPHSLSALLDFPITSSTEELPLTSKQKEMLTLRNYCEDGPPLTAAEKGKRDTLKLLICCGIDIHCHRRQNVEEIAMWLVWKEKRYENVQALLELDSPLPYDLDLTELRKSENTFSLIKQIKNRWHFHKAINKGLCDIVISYIENHPLLKCAYDCGNQSALMSALRAGQYDICALLQSERFSGSKN
jgi:ankyrin repeat protein